MTAHRISKKQTCPHCGNNPVNHLACYTVESLMILLAPLSKLTDPLQHPLVNKVSSNVIKPYAWLTRKMGLWNYHSDIENAVTDRTKVIWQEAKKRNIPMEGIEIMGKKIEQHRAFVKGEWHYFESLPIPPYLDSSAYTWIDDKGKLKTFLRSHKIPNAYGGQVTKLAEAMEIFENGTAPFIVKPRIGSRGRHTTTHIYTKDDMEKAFKVAKQLCYYVLVEEHLHGSVYRGTYVNGEVVGSLRGDPPRITGDGKHTIKQLIALKNKNKHKKVKDVVVTPHMEDFLARQNLNLNSILPKKKRIDLSEKIGISYGGFPAEEYEITHPKTLKYIKKAGDKLGAPVIGFDFIIEDITADPDTQRWGIIEANSLPFIDLHHFPLQGKPRNVAAKVWDLWNRT